MATLKKIEFVDFGPYKIIGKEIRTKRESFNPIFQSKYRTIPSLWQQCFSDGTFRVRYILMSDLEYLKIMDRKY